VGYWKHNGLQILMSQDFNGSDISLATWTDITIPNYLEQSCSYGSDDFTRGQAWYDLIITVKPDNENILLVGGSTRIPAIKRSIAEIMGKTPIEKVNVDEAVALAIALG